MIPLFNRHASSRTNEAFTAAVKTIGCEPEVLSAVFAVEAAGRSYDRHGRLTALFEPHVFHRVLSKHAPEKLAKAVTQGLAYPSWGEKPYPKDSYPRIEAARRIDEELALQAVSWGLPQILGENYGAAGYQSATDMVTSFLSGEDEQLGACAAFIVSNHLDDELQAKNWAAFARGYNGSGYAKHGYDKKLEAAYNAAKRKSAITVAAGGIATIGVGGAAGNETAKTGSTEVSGFILFGCLAAAVVLFVISRFIARPAAIVKPMPKIDQEIKPQRLGTPTVGDFEEKLAKVTKARTALYAAIAELNQARLLVADHLEALRDLIAKAKESEPADPANEGE